MKPLAIVPTYITSRGDLDVAAVAVRTLRETAGDACDLLVVDDASPDSELALELQVMVSEELGGEMILMPRNSGFSSTVNVGLRKALTEGRDAILVNADIEFTNTHWLRLMQEQRAENGTDLAGIVGARLLYPNGLVQHAGIYFSLIARTFDHIYRYAPGNLPEALEARTCPVTGALMFIRHTVLDDIGVFDEGFRMSFEDVDYNIRAWLAGHAIVYQPNVWAYHHESYFRGRKSEKIEKWTTGSWAYFVEKWADQSFAAFVPNLV